MTKERRAAKNSHLHVAYRLSVLADTVETFSSSKQRGTEADSKASLYALSQLSHGGHPIQRGGLEGQGENNGNLTQ